MKKLTLPEVPLTARTLDDALDTVFGVDTLLQVHGPSLRATPFDESGKRKFSFDVDIGTVPLPIRKFFCGKNLRVTTSQTLTKIKRRGEPTVWTVKNSLKPHFIGSEFFKLRPIFWLRRDTVDGVITVGGEVKHDAVLPPPLNDIAESFMMAASEKELRKFADVLESRLETASSPTPLSRLKSFMGLL